MSGDAIGMMEGAFFVSKGVILEWMNELLDVSTRSKSTNKKPKANFISISLSCNCLKSSSARRVLFTAR